MANTRDLNLLTLTAAGLGIGAALCSIKFLIEIIKEVKKEIKEDDLPGILFMSGPRMILGTISSIGLYSGYKTVSSAAKNNPIPPLAIIGSAGMLAGTALYHFGGRRRQPKDDQTKDLNSSIQSDEARKRKGI